MERELISATNATSGRASNPARHAHLFKVTPAIGALILVALALGCSEPPREKVRRVILISCDTLRADRLGMYGYARDTSPHLDAFARGSVVFERAYATAPHTNPALSSLLTSRMPDELGVAGGNRTLMPASVESLPELLAAAGIETAAIVSNWALRRAEGTRSDIGIAQGFDHFDDAMGTSAGLRDGHFERLADATTDTAIQWLKTREAASATTDSPPLFFWVHYQDPHGPYTPPADYLGRYQSEASGALLPQLGRTQEGYGQIPRYQILNDERNPAYYSDRYDEEIRFFDDEVGRLLAWLESNGLYEDSLIIFTADHGESLGEHNYWFTHEANLYDEEVRVPFVVRYPPGYPKPAGDSLVGHLDFLPSVLDAFGLPEAPARGKSLIARSLPGDRLFPHTLHKVDSPLRWSAITDARYRLLLRNGGAELYDLVEDPGETRNLASSQGSRIKSMLKRHRAFMLEVPALAPEREVELPLDDETRRALEALGYLPPSNNTSGDSAPDLDPDQPSQSEGR